MTKFEENKIATERLIKELEALDFSECDLKCNIKIVKEYKPTTLALLKLTGTDTIKDGCKALGISETLFRRWRTEGMSEATKNKYWGKDDRN